MIFSGEVLDVNRLVQMRPINPIGSGWSPIRRCRFGDSPSILEILRTWPCPTITCQRFQKKRKRKEIKWKIRMRILSIFPPSFRNSTLCSQNSKNDQKKKKKKFFLHVFLFFCVCVCVWRILWGILKDAREGSKETLGMPTAVRIPERRPRKTKDARYRRRHRRPIAVVAGGQIIER